MALFLGVELRRRGLSLRCRRPGWRCILEGASIGGGVGFERALMNVDSKQLDLAFENNQSAFKKKIPSHTAMSP
jgi:hypothetical protein